MTAATKASSPTPIQRRLLDSMYDDVARQLVEYALRPDRREAVMDSASEPGSMAESMTILVANLFRGESLEAVAARREASPTRFAAALQGALRRIGREIDE